MRLSIVTSKKASRNGKLLRIAATLQEKCTGCGTIIPTATAGRLTAGCRIFADGILLSSEARQQVFVAQSAGEAEFHAQGAGAAGKLFVKAAFAEATFELGDQTAML